MANALINKQTHASRTGYEAAHGMRVDFWLMRRLGARLPAMPFNELFNRQPKAYALLQTRTPTADG